MSKAIHKFAVPASDVPTIVPMDETAVIVHVEPNPRDAGSALMWAIVDTTHEEVRREFVIYGTGHKIDEARRYVGTAVGPVLVWHIFEVVL